VVRTSATNAAKGRGVRTLRIILPLNWMGEEMTSHSLSGTTASAPSGLSGERSSAGYIKKLATVGVLGLGMLIASAGDLFAMRCGNTLVLTGDRQVDVLGKCGEPDFITVEGWAYNFGPHQFIHYLRFDSGRLTEIDLGDYGWTEEDRKDDTWRFLPSTACGLSRGQFCSGASLMWH
jgi:hypothetical protein